MFQVLVILRTVGMTGNVALTTEVVEFRSAAEADEAVKNIAASPMANVQVHPIKLYEL